MENKQQQEPPARKSGPADHLANERTFLAWVRTSIALMGFGFIIVRFALFIRELSLVVQRTAQVPPKGISAAIGVLMVALGALLTILAYIRYVTIERQLNRNLGYVPPRLLTILLAVSIVVGSILLVIYLLPSV